MANGSSQNGKAVNSFTKNWVARRIGLFDAAPFGRYQLQARVLASVEQLEEVETRLTVWPERGGMPGASPVGPVFYSVNLILMFFALPGSVLWWLGTVLERHKIETPPPFDDRTL